MTPDERKHILRLALVERLSIAAISRRVDRDRSTVSGLLRSAEGLQLRQQLQGDEREQVLQLLKASGLSVAREWRHAVDVASNKGNHAPAKDWLLHAGLVDPIQDDTSKGGLVIQIGTPEHPIRVPSPLALLREEEDQGHGSK